MAPPTPDQTASKAGRRCLRMGGQVGQRVPGCPAQCCFLRQVAPQLHSSAPIAPPV